MARYRSFVPRKNGRTGHIKMLGLLDWRFHVRALRDVFEVVGKALLMLTLPKPASDSDTATQSRVNAVAARASLRSRANFRIIKAMASFCVWVTAPTESTGAAGGTDHETALWAHKPLPSAIGDVHRASSPKGPSLRYRR